MKIFYSNMGSATGLDKYLRSKIDILVSYYTIKKVPEIAYCRDLFLDSGAYSAYKQGSTIDIDKYADYLHRHHKEFFVCAALDVIGDPEATWKNQKYLDKQGLITLPCFHYLEDWKWLKLYADNYEYIAIGGGAIIGQNKQQLVMYYDTCWDIISRINPDIKVHAFGLQNESLMKRYPWFSVDASSVHMMARYGGVFTPWGAKKINQNVTPSNLKWQSPHKIKKVEQWVNSLRLRFTYDQAQEQTTEGTLRRCAVSVTYFEETYNDIIKPPVKPKNQLL